MHSIMFRCSLSLLLVGSLIASVEHAAACGNGKLILEDKFETLDPAWGFKKHDAERTIGSGGLTYKLDPDDVRSQTYEASLYENYEVCAVFTTADTKSAAMIGVLFWRAAGGDGYSVNLFVDTGTYSVYRTQNDKTLEVVAEKEDPSIAKGAGTNEVNVIVDGTKGTLSINGKKMVDFTGQPPEGGSKFGFDMSAPSLEDTSDTTTVTLKSIQLREVGTAK